MYFAIAAEANRHVSRLTWILVENLDTVNRELRSKTTYRFWANQFVLNCVVLQVVYCYLKLLRVYPHGADRPYTILHFKLH